MLRLPAKSGSDGREMTADSLRQDVERAERHLRHVSPTILKDWQGVELEESRAKTGLNRSRHEMRRRRSASAQTVCSAGCVATPQAKNESLNGSGPSRRGRRTSSFHERTCAGWTLSAKGQLAGGVITGTG
jgi:hypothetical protein